MDVTDSGAKADGLTGLPPGTACRLMILNEAVPSVVRWSAGGSAGLIFERALTAASARRGAPPPHPARRGRARRAHRAPRPPHPRLHRTALARHRPRTAEAPSLPRRSAETRSGVP